MRDKSTEIHQKTTLNSGGKLIDLSQPKVMGILNLTPDSFYDGGKHHLTDTALRKTAQMLEEGADFIDIGAYSSRPGAVDIPIGEETNRLLPVVKAVVKEFPEAIISIDTFRSEVASAMIAEGSHIINDISAGELDPCMFETLARLKVPYIMMHMKGTPQTMKGFARYDDLFAEICGYFIAKVKQLHALGIHDLMIDPGFGFAKTAQQSFQLLGMLKQFKIIGQPILAGLSRKSMIYKTLGIDAAEALNGTTAANTIAILNGASVLRVHDVKEAKQTIRIVSETLKVH